jgi:lipopolysaccharide cholinephosphotransferase
MGRTYEDNGYYEAIPHNVVYPLKDIEFEGKMYSAPNDPHKYMFLMYGKNYMVPPPVEQRIPHAKIVLPNTPCNHPRAMKRPQK